jgi:hypothetical protein
MSLAIDTDNITRVLLADGWHDVANQSFDIDSYEYMWCERLVHGGGNSGICASGFTFTTTDGLFVCGPLTSVLAVEQGQES